METAAAVASAVALLLALSGIGANAKSASYIWTTFPMGKSAIFFLAFYDAFFSLAANAAFAATFPIAYYYRDFTFCTANLISALLQHFSGFLITAEIAILRYLSFVYGKKKKPLSERRCLAFCLALHVGQCAYVVGHLLVDMVTADFVPMAVVVCVGGGSALPENFHSEPSVVAKLGMVWACSLPAASALFGALIVLDLWRNKGQVGPTASKKEGSNPKYSIPVKATFAAVGLLIFGALAFLTAYSFDLDLNTRFALAVPCLVMMNAARCPLQTLLTFGSKVRADQKNKAKRQERERQWALQEREERRNRMRKIRFRNEVLGLGVMETAV